MKICVLPALGLVVVFAGSALTQSPQERVAELAEWRENCGDPNPDFRLAYLEAAVDSGDATVARICIGQALSSDDADMRELGLRAALAQNDRITFQLELPAEVIAAREAAQTSVAQNDFRNRWGQTVQRVEEAGGAITLVKQQASAGSNSSTWIALDDDGEVDDVNAMVVTVRGATLDGTGRGYYGGRRQLVIDAELNDEGVLVGTVRIGEYGPYPARSDLL